jgi:hypothetical protein
VITIVLVVISFVVGWIIGNEYGYKVGCKDGNTKYSIAGVGSEGVVRVWEGNNE